MSVLLPNTFCIIWLLKGKDRSYMPFFKVYFNYALLGGIYRQLGIHQEQWSLSLMACILYVPCRILNPRRKEEKNLRFGGSVS